MKKEKSDQNAVAELTREWLYKENKWLWEENKKLKEKISELEDVSKDYDLLSKDFITLGEENEKLNEKIEHLEFDIYSWKKLKSVWEKKEQKLQIEIWWLMWERDGLQMVVERLQKELGECECSFWFENDEVWFWKREYKRLKKWIKDHCKWYWNLFPEDEMKRQWKKADKKRKEKSEEKQ